MSGNTRDRNVTPKSIYDYVQGLLKVQDTEDQQKILEDAVGICFNSFTQKKLQWDIYLEKLMQLFLDLAFQTEKLSKIKQVLKSYRSITQNQHPDSLKTILEYYRDNKLQQLLNDQIPKDSIDFIRQMKSVQDDEASSSLIISSFSPDTKNKKEWIRVNLKTVWEGYKTILDTVRLNQKMEGVYRDTLKKIFEFVNTYNRKHQFKGICDNERKYGLKNILSKRGDKSEQQKNYYIDIEKQEINTNNIEIRFEQFDLATKLGLWQQAFQTLEDIKEIMRVRKGPVKNLLKCSYFERLALIFKKSNYWHYHAYAFFNYYSIYITKSKLSVQQKTRIADKLVLSILCIPPSTLQSSQSKESQQKIATMMISGNKIPEKKELEEMMVSRGVIENASSSVKQLWYFMFLDFDLTSLNKGIKLLQIISKDGQYQDFIELLEDILIYKQLISLAEVYQRMKYDSLISIIPFPKQKIQRVLLECHHKKVIDFVLDEKQGIIIFEDQFEETNPYEQFLSCYVDVAILHEESRKHDKQFIIKKTIDFMSTADDYYNNIRVYKIDQYKKKLKKPRQELQEKERQKERKIQEQKRNQQLQKKIKEEEQRKQNEQKMKIFINKKVRINEIIAVKQNRIVKIGNKRVQNLTDQQIKEMDYQIFQEGLKEISARVANDRENRNKKRYLKIDYLERERRCLIKEEIEKSIPDEKKEKEEFEKIVELSKAQHAEKQKLKKEIYKAAPQVKTKIDQHYNENMKNYEQNLKKFKQNLTDQFKKKILNKARELYEQTENKKKKDEQDRKKEMQSNSTQSSMTSWSIGKNLAKNTTSNTGDVWARKERTTEKTQESTTGTKETTAKKEVKTDTWFKKGPTTGVTESNTFSGMKIEDDDKKDAKKQKWAFGKNVEKTQKVEQQKKEETGGWLGKKKATESDNTTTQAEIKPKFVAPPVVESESKGAWGRSAATNQSSGDAPPRRQQPELVFKSGPAKKDDKKPTKGKGW